MNRQTFLRSILLMLSFSVILGCKSDDDAMTSNQRTFGIFRVLDNNTTIVMHGEIGDQTLNQFNALVAQYPNVNRIEMNQVPGSFNDDINLQVSQRVHDLGIDTHLLDNGLIASGGVDFFLAGTTRTMGSNAMIGVHSWGGEDDNGQTVTATDFPVGHAYHLPYINYYVSVGFSQQAAEDFYYFTINAASAEDIHYMTPEEIAQYQLLTP